MSLQVSAEGPLPRPFILAGMPTLMFAGKQQMQMTSRYLSLTRPFQPFLPTWGRRASLCAGLPLVLSDSKPTDIITFVVSGSNPQKAAACPDFPQKPDQSRGPAWKVQTMNRGKRNGAQPPHQPAFPQPISIPEGLLGR